jgi:hypothetical protein
MLLRRCDRAKHEWIPILHCDLRGSVVSGWQTRRRWSCEVSFSPLASPLYVTQDWSAEDVLLGAGGDGDGDQDWAGVYSRVQMPACHSVLLRCTSMAC